MATTRIRLQQVLPSDDPDDQKSPADIAAVHDTAMSAQDEQILFLSRLREIVFGHTGGPIRHWFDDFQSQGIRPLAELSGSSLGEAQHLVLRQLVHLADGVGGPMEGWASGAYRETLPAGSPFPTEIIWWTNSTRTKKIIVKSLVLDTKKQPLTVTWTAYDADGTTAIAQVRDEITYTSVFEVSRTRTVT